MSRRRVKKNKRKKENEERREKIEMERKERKQFHSALKKAMEKAGLCDE